MVTVSQRALITFAVLVLQLGLCWERSCSANMPQLPPAPFKLKEPLVGRGAGDIDAQQQYEQAMAIYTRRPLEALKLISRVMAADELPSGSLYDAACIYALNKRVPDAVYWLQRAAHEAGVDATHAANDPDLSAVRASKYWRQLSAFLRTTQRRWNESGFKKVITRVPAALQGKEKAAVLVWLHGMGASPEGLERFMAVYGARLGFVYLAVSATSPNGPNRFTWSEDHARDRAHVRTVLRAEEKRLGMKFEPVVLLGFSQGAQLAVNLALREPWVDGLIALSPGWAGTPRDIFSAESVKRNGKGAVVVHAEVEHPDTIKSSKEDAKVLQRAGFDVMYRSTTDHVGHSFPPDFVEMFPSWWKHSSAPGRSIHVKAEAP